MSQAARAALERLGFTPLRLTPVHGGSICQAWRADTERGSVFVKLYRAGASQMFTTEAAGLSWLREAGAPVPGVIAAADDVLVLSWHDPVDATPKLARGLGRALAELHTVPADAFGIAPPGATRGWIGSAPMPYGRWETWGPFYTEARVLPYAEQAHGSGNLTRREFDVIGRVCRRLSEDDPALTGSAGGPCRVHGDLWHGNILWTDPGALLIDAAAHGGSGLGDLAMLELFGVSFLQEILTGYESVRALPPRWRETVGLHQLFPLLVHAVLFGGGYGSRAAAIARGYVRGS